MTVELKEKDAHNNFIQIPDVFVITASPKGYFVIVDKNNKVMQIMKDSIHELIYQKDEESVISYSRWNLPQ